MKNLKMSSFIVAIVWTVIMLFAVAHNSSNERFVVTHFQYHQTPGYAAVPAYYQISGSPSIAWDKSAGFGRTLGYIFLGLMWVMTYIVATDRYLGKNTGDPDKERKAEKTRPVLGIFMIGVPLLLSLIFFFSNYSKEYTGVPVSVDEQTFNQWVQDGKIEQKGEKTWVDGTGDKVLLNLFSK